jgi:hypothetical protein
VLDKICSPQMWFLWLWPSSAYWMVITPVTVVFKPDSTSESPSFKNSDAGAHWWAYTKKCWYQACPRRIILKSGRVTLRHWWFESSFVIQKCSLVNFCFLLSACTIHPPCFQNNCFQWLMIFYGCRHWQFIFVAKVSTESGIERTHTSQKHWRL